MNLPHASCTYITRIFYFTVILFSDTVTESCMNPHHDRFISLTKFVTEDVEKFIYSTINV